MGKKKEIMRIPFTGNTHNRQTTAKKHAAKSILPNRSKLAWLNYMVGVGANRASTHQGDIGFEKWTFRPMLSLQTSVIKNVSLSLEGEAEQRKLNNADYDSGIK